MMRLEPRVLSLQEHMEIAESLTASTTFCRSVDNLRGKRGNI